MAGELSMLTVHRRYVIDANGAPVPAATIVFAASSVPMPEIALYADENGQFVVRLPPGRFTLRAHGPEGRLTEILGKGEAFRNSLVPFKEGEIACAYYNEGRWVNIYDMIPRGPEAIKVNQAIRDMKPEEIPKYDAMSLADWLNSITDDQKVKDFVYLMSAAVLTHADPYNMAAGSYFRIVRDPSRDPEKVGL